MIVGLCPSKDGPKTPFSPKTTSGKLLLLILGRITYPEIKSHFRLVNLCDRPLGYPVGPEARAILSKSADAFRLEPTGLYIFAGTEVLRAFGARVLPPEGRKNLKPLRYWRARDGGPICAILPHPSGRNRFYNSRANRARAKEFLSACVLLSGGHLSGMTREDLEGAKML